MASGKPLSPSTQAIRTSATPRCLSSVRTCRGELRALGLLKPHPEHVAVAVDGDAEREVTGAALDAAALADLEDQAVEEDHRIDVLQRPLLPRADVLQDGVGDAADQVVADVDAVDLSEMRLNVTDRQPARVKRDDLLVKAGEATLALRHDLRRKAALAIPGRLDPNRAMLGHKRLRRAAVARVPGPAGRRLTVLVAEVLGQLGIHRSTSRRVRSANRPPGPTISSSRAPRRAARRSAHR
jgi:hypothetical protein